MPLFFIDIVPLDQAVFVDAQFDFSARFTLDALVALFTLERFDGNQVVPGFIALVMPLDVAVCHLKFDFSAFNEGDIGNFDEVMPFLFTDIAPLDDFLVAAFRRVGPQFNVSAVLAVGHDEGCGRSVCEVDRVCVMEAVFTAGRLSDVCNADAVFDRDQCLRAVGVSHRIGIRCFIGRSQFDGIQGVCLQIQICDVGVDAFVEFMRTGPDTNGELVFVSAVNIRKHVFRRIGINCRNFCIASVFLYLIDRVRTDSSVIRAWIGPGQKNVHLFVFIESELRFQIRDRRCRRFDV